jgi:hypothetical protein
VSCGDASIAPLADYTVRRVRGRPAIGGAIFNSTVAQRVKVCIDGVNATAGWVLVNLDVVATPPDFGMGTVHFERPSFVNRGFNASAALLMGAIGASIHVRIIPDPVPPPAPLWADVGNVGGGSSADNGSRGTLRPASDTPTLKAGMGCASGPTAAGVLGLVILAAVTLRPRARVAVRAAQRRR